MANPYEGTECKMCGDERRIHFHHIFPPNKLWNISATPKKYLEFELEKCVPLCPSCHRKVHTDKLESHEKYLVELEPEKEMIWLCGSVSGFYSMSKEKLLEFANTPRLKKFVRDLFFS